MKIRRLPLTPGLLWIVSVAVAYQAGARLSGDGRGRELTVEPPAITFAPGSAGVRPGDEEEREAEAGNSAGGEAKARQLIEAASREMGSGGGAMFSPATMFRACGPLMELSVEEVKAALAEVKLTVTDTQQRALLETILLGRWAEEDPLAALAYAEKLSSEDGAMAGQALFSVIGVWAQKDPEAALAWYRKRRDSNEPAIGPAGDDGALMMIFNGLGVRDPERALDRLGLLDNDQSRRIAISGIAMAATDSSLRLSLLERAETMDTGTRDALRQGIVGQWAATAPDAAMDWIGSLPPEESSALLDMSGQSFLFANPEKGAEFLLETATDATLARRYSQIVNTWSLRDPIAAGEWLNRQPKDPAQDGARSAFALNVVRTDPEVAMEWAKSVSEELQREGSVQAVYAQWLRRHPEAAEAALRASGLSDERVEVIRSAAAK